MALDPNRYRRAELGNPDHKLPMPNGRFFDPKGQFVDLFDGHVLALLRDRSIVLRDAPAEPVAEVPVIAAEAPAIAVEPPAAEEHPAEEHH